MSAASDKERRSEIERLSWEAWDAAWDAAREEDDRAGRRYDKRIYADKAHDARTAVLVANGIEARP